jgi:cobalamin-dependent methionine synthase I
MYIIGENIQILAPKIKAAIADRDATYVRQLARTQVDHGADMLDLNIGPRKRDGIEVMQWMIEEVYDEVGAVPLSLDNQRRRHQGRVEKVHRTGHPGHDQFHFSRPRSPQHNHAHGG